MKVTTRIFSLAIAAAMVLANSYAVSAAPVSVTTNGQNYAQNFDTLATSGTTNVWTNDSTPLAAWFANQSGGTLSTYRAGDGSSNAGALYSFGTGTATDRALGSVSSGTPQTIAYGPSFSNDSGGNITHVDVSYLGEQWRDGGAATPAAQSITFFYAITATPPAFDLQVTPGPPAAWTAVPALDFTSPVFTNTGSGVALDGNLPANQTAKSGGFDLVVPPGSVLYIGWRDINDTGNDHGLAVDNLSVTFTTVAVPEPSTFILAGFGVVGLIGVARRRKSA